MKIPAQTKPDQAELAGHRQRRWLQAIMRMGGTVGEDSGDGKGLIYSPKPSSTRGMGVRVEAGRCQGREADARRRADSVFSGVRTREAWC